MKKGKAFIITGLLCIAAALVLVFYNLWDSKRAGNAAHEALEAVEEKMNTDPVPQEGRMHYKGADDFAEDAMEYPDYVLNPAMELPVVAVDGIDFVGKLSIPALGIELPVCSTWDYDNLKIGPCRFAGTPYRDDLVICAHNYPTQFGNLPDLSYGDSIVFTDMDGNEFSYIVMEIIVLEPEAKEEMTSGDWDLTLFTCTPGGAARVAVRCEGKER